MYFAVDVRTCGISPSNHWLTELHTHNTQCSLDAKVAIIKTLVTISPLEGYDVPRADNPVKSIVLHMHALASCMVTSSATLLVRIKGEW